jgi:hypothetical protein
MSLRPASANWFELLVMRDDLAAAMKVLASSRRVELQSHGEGRAPMLMPECRELLEEFDELERLYRHHWPPPAPHEHDERAEPYNMLQHALDRLRRWAADARDVVERLERLTERSNDQDLLLEMLRDAESLPDLAQFSQAGPMLDSALFLLGSGEWPTTTPGTVITQRVVIPAHRFLMAVGLPDEMSELEHQLHAQRARRLALPKDLPPKAADAETAMRNQSFETRQRARAFGHGELRVDQRLDQCRTRRRAAGNARRGRRQGSPAADPGPGRLRGAAITEESAVDAPVRDVHRDARHTCRRGSRSDPHNRNSDAAHVRLHVR